MSHSPVKGFISVVSQDKVADKILGQIQKLSTISIWIMKARALLDEYRLDLSRLDLERDSVQMGKLIQAGESHFMTSVSYYLRCFLNQPTLYLQIEQVTNDPNLVACYRELMELRNDEFVHWKGVRSTVAVTYSVEVVNLNQFDFAKDLNVAYSDKIGPSNEAEMVAELYVTTLSYVENRRNELLGKLRTVLSQPDVFLKTQFLNENGESIIKTV